MKEIQLTQGKVTQVDDDMFDYLNQWKWCAHYKKDVKGWYAERVKVTLFVRETISMHRLIMNAPIGMEVDHRDHNTLNNQSHNLRLATKSQNAQNRKKRNDNTSGYKGVSWYRRNKKWGANIKGVYLGLFDTAEEAAKVYDAKARELFGEFASVNFKE